MSRKVSYKVVVVDDDQTILQVLQDFFTMQGAKCEIFSDARNALEFLEKNRVDLVITDLVMPRIDGIFFINSLQAINRNIPVIVMTGYGTIDHAVESMKAGAADFITKPINFDHLNFVIKRIMEKKLLEKIASEKDYYQELSFTDALTSLSNFRHFNHVIDKELARHKRYNRPLTLMIADIDNFKFFNDIYGHQFGDQVLVEIARILRNFIRESDFVARYGGEEFVIVMPEVSKSDAIQVARRILNAVKKTDLKFLNPNCEQKLSITIGVSSYPDDGASKEQLISEADKALYFGKNNGKSCVVLAASNEIFQ